MSYTEEFEQFFKDNENRVYRIIRSYFKDRDTTKDIVLEAMMKVYSLWERVRHFENKEGYLVRIAINMAKKYHLRNKLKNFLPIADYENDFQDPRNPEMVFFDREEDNELQEQLDNLKPIERDIIILKDIDGNKFEEIAQLMNQKLPTVKSIYRRAKIKIASRLSESPYDSVEKEETLVVKD